MLFGASIEDKNEKFSSKHKLNKLINRTYESELTRDTEMSSRRDVSVSM